MLPFKILSYDWIEYGRLQNLNLGSLEKDCDLELDLKGETSNQYDP